MALFTHGLQALGVLLDAVDGLGEGDQLGGGGGVCLGATLRLLQLVWEGEKSAPAPDNTFSPIFSETSLTPFSWAVILSAKLF